MRYQTGIDSDRNRSIGIILANLGTPDAPDSPAVRKFLAQFLHDHRVIELHRMIWCPYFTALFSGLDQNAVPLPIKKSGHPRDRLF